MFEPPGVDIGWNTGRGGTDRTSRSLLVFFGELILRHTLPGAGNRVIDAQAPPAI